MYGLVDIQRSIDDSAENGIESTARLETNREQADDALKIQDNINKKNSIAQGMGAGATIGMAAGPGGALVGAALGAGAGYLTHEFF